MKSLIIVILTQVLVYGKNSLRNNLLVGQAKQSNHGKSDADTLQVHLIPHSHDDVGWLKTYEEYYYGLNNKVQFAGIQYTIDSVVRSLYFDSTKKFIQVEIAFFKIWWDDQTEDIKNKTRQLVENGQLEFINGGWCMNDEATAYYEDIIDQMTVGHKFILDNFNKQPTIGWQLDPFGHSNAQAMLSHLMGFNAWFFSRIDYQDMQLRKDTKAMELVMLPQQYPIFTHINYNHYEAPPQFSFDAMRQFEPIVDNPKMNNYNVEPRAKQLVEYFYNQANAYQNKVLMHTMGSDFAFSNAQMYYKNMDRLIKYINEHKQQFNMEIKYSTPSEYIKAINDLGQEYPTKKDDFLPYADKVNAYWTGYFTSRVSFKLYVKQLGRQAQVLRRLLATLYANGKSQYVAVNKKQVLAAFQQLDEGLATCQHHDAITGTAKQHVNDDYIDILSKAEYEVQTQMNPILNELVQFETQDEEQQSFVQCNWNNTAESCSMVYEQITQNKPVQINLISSRTDSQQDYLRIKVPQVNLKIYNHNNLVVYGDIFCITTNNCDLFIIYQQDPKLLLQYFRIIATELDDSSATIVQATELQNLNPEEISLNGSKPFSISYQYYQSSSDRQQSSGAYIFRPHESNQEPIEFGSILGAMSYVGRFVHIITIARENLSTIIRKFAHQEDTYNIETFIRDIQVSDGFGKEIIMKIRTDILNEDIFYTDSAGMQMQRRQINHRDTWNLTVHQPISGNYYPINSILLIKDADGNAAALLNDRVQGGSSLNSGEMEMMIHRRILRDDARGVGEALNEENEEGGALQQYFMHTLTFFNSTEQPNHPRQLQYELDFKATVYYSNCSKEVFKPTVKSFKNTFPKDIDRLFSSKAQSVTKLYLQYWNDNSYLYRIHNLGENGTYPIPTLDSFTITETTITGNQLWSDWKQSRLKWKLQNQTEQFEEYTQEVQPQQIRTFLITKMQK